MPSNRQDSRGEIRGRLLDKRFDVREELETWGLELRDGNLSRKNHDEYDSAADAYNDFASWAKEQKLGTSGYNGEITYNDEETKKLFAHAYKMLGDVPEKELSRQVWMLAVAFLRYQAQPDREQVIDCVADENGPYNQDGQYQEKGGFRMEYRDAALEKKPADFKALADEWFKRNRLRRAVRDHFQGKNSDIDARRLMNIGCTGYQSGKKFLEVWDEVSVDGRPFGSCYNPDAPNVLRVMERLPQFPPHVLAAVINTGAQDRRHIRGPIDPERPGRPASLFSAAKAWKLSPVMWKGVAERVGEMPLWKRMVAAGIANKMAEEQGITIRYRGVAPSVEYPNSNQPNSQDSSNTPITPAWHKNRELRNEFWQRFIKAVEKGHVSAIIENVNDAKGNRRRAIQIFHPRAELNDEEIKTLITYGSVASIAGMKLGAWRKAQKYFDEKVGTEQHTRIWTEPAVLGIISVFGNNWEQWLKQQPVGRDHKARNGLHDATVWLPTTASTKQLEGLDRWLFKFKDREISELGVVAKNWAGLNEHQRKLPYKYLLAACRSKKYIGQKSDEFASEAARWGVSEQKYPKYEALYLQSQKVPELVDSTKKWEKGGLVGRFLPRSDPRVGFFGQHTNCCQHFEGVGASCAKSSVSDPFSQLFVIERVGDKGNSQIVAGSWVWESVAGVTDPENPEKKKQYKTICFDNIEGLDLPPNQQLAGVEIYQEVADYLAKEKGYRKVTIGTVMSRLPLDQWKRENEPLPLPRTYSGYTDSSTQSRMAENLKARSVDAKEEKIWVRGALEADLQAAEQVAKACYPKGHDHISMPDGNDPRGMVLVHESKGIIGYVVWSEDQKEITDMAVLPEYRKHAPLALVDAMRKHCKQSGGEWTMDARESTSYRLLKAYQKRGLIEMSDNPPVSYTMPVFDSDNNPIMDGNKQKVENVYSVKLRAIEREMDAPTHERDRHQPKITSARDRGVDIGHRDTVGLPRGINLTDARDISAGEIRQQVSTIS